MVGRRVTGTSRSNTYGVNNVRYGSFGTVRKSTRSSLVPCPTRKGCTRRWYNMDLNKSPTKNCKSIMKKPNVEDKHKTWRCFTVMNMSASNICMRICSDATSCKTFGTTKPVMSVERKSTMRGCIAITILSTRVWHGLVRNCTLTPSGIWNRCLKKNGIVGAGNVSTCMHNL
jgi:hypothetical protein